MLATVTDMLEHVGEVPAALQVAGETSEHARLFVARFADPFPVMIAHRRQKLPSLLIAGDPPADFLELILRNALHSWFAVLALADVPGNMPTALSLGAPAIA